ncbi:hypothetical protein BDV96DRAFT_595157 [Lophiotrema nucula]|uniref:Uncharacterized protein n=1 Tax=Lophiotrema nucula TaxID=690887 RepID=A0A6A5ZNG2_9PLEO|nr:hypothetical protein BDV96DRAFT_595157 [Lophiotrema nucula]
MDKARRPGSKYSLHLVGLPCREAVDLPARLSYHCWSDTNGLPNRASAPSPAPRQPPLVVNAHAQTIRTTTAPPSPFSDNAAQLISLYIPTSVESLFYSVYTSVESTTGDPASVIESAFTAITPPSWLDAVPTEYQSNIEALESAIESLRVAATGGVGATVAPASTVASASIESSATTSASSSGVTSESSSGTTSASESLTTSEEATPAGTMATPSFDWGDATASSSGFAQPTKVPMAAAGVLGVIGVVLAL